MLLSNLHLVLLQLEVLLTVFSFEFLKYCKLLLKILHLLKLGLHTKSSSLMNGLIDTSDFLKLGFFSANNLILLPQTLHQRLDIWWNILDLLDNLLLSSRNFDFLSGSLSWCFVIPIFDCLVQSVIQGYKLLTDVGNIIVHLLLHLFSLL